VNDGIFIRRANVAVAPGRQAAGVTATEAVQAAYRPDPGIYDEALDPGGRPRPDGGAGLRWIGERELGALAEDVRASAADSGVAFHSVDGDRAFVVDPVPRVFSADEWAALEAGLVQRVRALNAFVADVYGPRLAVAEGVVPERVVTTAANLEPGMMGVRPPGDLWVGVAGLDVVRDPAGELLVLEDNLMTPSGFGYAVAARAAVTEGLGPLPPGPRPRPVAGVTGLLAATLASVAPRAGDPRVVLLTDGPDNSAGWEHEWIAAALCVPLVEPRDLSVHGDELWDEDGRVDVVYRRTDADRLDTPVGELLARPLHAGTLAVVNAFGTGVADDKLAHAYVEAMIAFYLGEQPLVRSVQTLDLARPEALEEALDRFDELVVKPRAGHGGIGVVVCPHAEPADIEAARERVRARPADYVAQPLICLSQHPTVVDGRLRPRHVDLRPFVFLRAGGGASVMPGGLTRVALGKGALVVNSTQNGGAKDTWVLA
jgi:uncharacterized circularly permuted ATP-grasp superfamily protein